MIIILLLCLCLILPPLFSLSLSLSCSCFPEKRGTRASPGHTDKRWLTWRCPHRGGHGVCMCGGVGCFSHCLSASSCSSDGVREAGPRPRGWHRDAFWLPGGTEFYKKWFCVLEYTIYMCHFEYYKPHSGEDTHTFLLERKSLNSQLINLKA